MKPLRWGICGAGKISNDFVNAIIYLPRERHQILAVAARSAERASQFANDHSIPKFYSDYGSLFSDKDIDIVYVGVVNSSHEEVVIAALEAGKHVLCEKPMGLNAASTKRMIEKARSKHLFFMEGYWTRVFPASKKLLEELDAGVIGEPKVFSANFGFNLASDVMDKNLGGGGFMAIGCYCVMLADFVFFREGKSEKPSKITVSGSLNEKGVDTTASVILQYSGGRTATLVYTTEASIPNDAYVGGTNGFLQLPEYFWCPSKLVTPKQTYNFPLPPDNGKPFFYPRSIGLQYEAEHVRECIEKGLTEAPSMSWENSLLLSETNDEILRQLGIAYDLDTE